MIATSKMEKYLGQGKRKFEIEKKGMLKVKTFWKIAILDEQEPSIQSADRTKAVQVWSWKNNMYSPTPGNWGHHSIYIWKWEPRQEEFLWRDTLASFMKQ